MSNRMSDCASEFDARIARTHRKIDVSIFDTKYLKVILPLLNMKRYEEYYGQRQYLTLQKSHTDWSAGRCSKCAG